MYKFIPGLCLLLTIAQCCSAQSNQDSTLKKTYTKEEQEIINLSKQKWQWMADKNPAADRADHARPPADRALHRGDAPVHRAAQPDHAGPDLAG